MSIQREKLPSSIIAAAAVVTVVFLWQQNPEARAASTAPSSGSQFGAPANESLAAPQGTPAPVTTRPTSIRQKMKTADDWYALAKEILPQAKAGDPEAQYVMFKMSRVCQFRYQTKFDSESAARDRATAIGLSADNAAKTFHQCQGFSTNDAQSLGDPWDWLQKATDAGYPPAQAATANERLLQDQSKAFARAGAQATDTATHAPIGGDSSPRELLAVAAQSADPEVLSTIGNLQYLLHPTQPKDVTNINTAAWMYAACQRDCSGFGSTTAINCRPNDRNCVGVPNWLLKQVNYNWAPVQERVDQINAALKAKQWDQLPGLTTGG